MTDERLRMLLTGCAIVTTSLIVWRFFKPVQAVNFYLGPVSNNSITVVPRRAADPTRADRVANWAKAISEIAAAMTRLGALTG
ncbi:hypothetical protein GCM10007148_26110 [Parvularcula lutaonensis]|nr:hypothetical protein GCM10007148_26110 [Parvularcula lutaonensis]